jgi:hypothetical protein
MRKYVPWIVALAILWVVFGTIYGTVQQAQRNDANMPQIQLAEDAAALLNNEDSVASQIAQKVDMAKSLAPFTIIYDKKGNVIGGSGYLDGKVAKAPLGILEASNGKDFNAVTWQPKDDVRIAAVTTSAKSFYVLSGRNLKQVEANENQTLEIAIIGGLLATCLLGIAVAIYTSR